MSDSSRHQVVPPPPVGPADRGLMVGFCGGCGSAAFSGEVEVFRPNHPERAPRGGGAWSRRPGAESGRAPRADRPKEHRSLQEGSALWCGIVVEGAGGWAVSGLGAGGASTGHRQPVVARFRGFCGMPRLRWRCGGVVHRRTEHSHPRRTGAAYTRASPRVNETPGRTLSTFGSSNRPRLIFGVVVRPRPVSGRESSPPPYPCPVKTSEYKGEHDLSRLCFSCAQGVFWLGGTRRRPVQRCSCQPRGAVLRFAGIFAFILCGSASTPC